MDGWIDGYLFGWMAGWMVGRQAYHHRNNIAWPCIQYYACITDLLPGLPGGFKAVVITSICYYYLYFMNVCMYVLFLFFVVVFLIITGKHCIGIAFAKTKIFTYEENRMDFS